MKFNKKNIFYTFLLTLVLVSAANVYAVEFTSNEQKSIVLAKTNAYIKSVYNRLSFQGMNKLSYAAFSKGFYGYLNLKDAGKIQGNALLTICDFTLSSNSKRLWVIDIARKKVLTNTLVAHGSGSGEEYATHFSNIAESHTSSLGFYQTAETYMGNNGYSLKLNGLDGMFNSNAYERAIVIHGADYVSTDFAKANNRLGRSHGCPALPRALAEPIINKIANGSCLFIYHTANNYLQKSHWLTKTINRLPQEAEMLEVLAPKKINNPKWVDDNEPNDGIASNIKKSTKQLAATSPARIISKGNSTTKETIGNTEKSKDQAITKIAPIKDNATLSEPIIPAQKTFKVKVDTIYTSNGNPVLVQRRVAE